MCKGFTFTYAVYPRLSGGRVNVRQHARAIAFNPPRHASQDIRERYNVPRMNIIVRRCAYKDTCVCVYICIYVDVLFD